MNGYYNRKDGTRLDYLINPNDEKQLFKDAINDRLFQQNLVGVEIGVLNGETSGFFLNEFSNLHLIGIDPIIPDSMEASLIGNLEIIQENVKANVLRWTFYQNYSFNVVNQFDDASVDFIFIDGDHTYQAVEQDYSLYFPKIKSNGLIFLHDSRMFRGGANFHVGSSQFADFIIANDSRIELIGEAFSLTCFRKK
jgi:hypothetical protein